MIIFISGLGIALLGGGAIAQLTTGTRHRFFIPEPPGRPWCASEDQIWGNIFNFSRGKIIFFQISSKLLDFKYAQNVLNHRQNQ